MRGSWWCTNSCESEVGNLCKVQESQDHELCIGIMVDACKLRPTIFDADGESK